MAEKKPAKLAAGKSQSQRELPVKTIKLRLPRNYERTPDGYIIR